MRELLEDFDTVFDLEHRVRDVPLRELLESALTDLGQTHQEWGTQGQRHQLYSDSGRFVSFFYRPHLFPGMEPKLRLAHELQFRLLPQSLPAEAPVSISAVLESYCHLSGDLFGWEVLKSGSFLIWIADMAGHGIRAGLASAVLHVLIRNSTRRDRLDLMMSDLNRMLHDCLRPGHDSLYATLFVMTLDEGGRAAYCSAGHPPVLVRRAHSTDELESTDRPIGLFPDTKYSSRQVELERGSRLLLYTDGVIESKGRHNELFGTERLRRVFERVESGPRELTDTIYREIAGWQNIDELDDDLTFLAVQL